MQNLSRVVARNSAFGLAAQLAIKVLSFAFSVLVIRNLGVEAFGQYAGILAFGAVFVFIADLGLSPYAVREVARWRDRPDGIEQTNTLYGNVLLLRFLLSLLAAILVIGTAWLTGRPPVIIGAIALGTLGLLMYSVQGTSEAILSGFERLDLTAGAKVLNQLIFVLIGALVLWLGFGYYGLIVANLLGVGLMTYVCWRGVQRLGVRPRQIIIRSWPTLLRASLPFGIIGFTLGLSYKFASVLLSIFAGDTATGYYNAAYNLVFSTVILSNILNTALYPTLSRHSVTSPHSLPKVYERALRYLMALSLPIAVGTWAVADQLVLFLFDAAYQPAAQALKIVILVVPFMFASEFLGYVVVIAGNERRVARSIAVSTGFNIVMNLYMVPHYGLIGAAIMTVVTEAILIGQYAWILRGVLRNLNWRRILLRPLLAALLMGGLVLALPSLPLLVNVMVGAITYVGLLLLLGVVGKEELAFVRGLRQPQVEATTS
jgi:O-antigen/teichoic acid export membrane protein